MLYVLRSHDPVGQRPRLRLRCFFQGDYGILRARHLTVNQCNTLGLDDGYDSSLHLTNSLLVVVTNWGDIPYSTATNKVVYYATNPGGIFQTVGAGAHYLANNRKK